jgi:hypothetical protein
LARQAAVADAEDEADAEADAEYPAESAARTMDAEEPQSQLEY